MEWIYHCPHCRGMLNPDETIILIALREGHQLLVGLHPEPGNYHMHLPPGAVMDQGSRWSFHCPLCRIALTSDLNPDLCGLDLTSGGSRHRIFFSRLAGEEATFILSAEGLLTNYGTHRDKYVEELVQRMYT